MEGVRRGARAVLRYFAPLYAVAIIVQVFLAGEGIFGIKKVNDLDDAGTLDAHRGLGFILTEPVALLFLIAALLAWHPDTRVRIVSIVAPIMTFVQALLAEGGRWVGAFHPVNALLILGLYGWLSYRFWRVERAPIAGAAAAPRPGVPG